ncbi:hypothetical protein Ae707Ps1_5771c [Pseudonocardia sp. Ae707_Ps1]|nr:hypothetical protein Ae707Ps1_5771c [Pseudonocardia sp. Ae707_Ps1]
MEGRAVDRAVRHVHDAHSLRRIRGPGATGRGAVFGGRADRPGRGCVGDACVGVGVGANVGVGAGVAEAPADEDGGEQRPGDQKGRREQDRIGSSAAG